MRGIRGRKRRRRKRKGKRKGNREDRGVMREGLSREGRKLEILEKGKEN